MTTTHTPNTTPTDVDVELRDLPAESREIRGGQVDSAGEIPDPTAALDSQADQVTSGDQEAPGQAVVGWVAPVVDRRPVVPVWLADRESRRAAAAHTAATTRYHVAFHGLRAPVYGARLAWWTAKGAATYLDGFVSWLQAADGSHELQAAAVASGDAHVWQSLAAARQRRSRARGWLTTAAMVLAVAVVWVMVVVAPVGLPVLVVGGMGVAGFLCAKRGRPEGGRVVSAVTPVGGRRLSKLTAPMVVDALLATGVCGKDPAAVDVVADPHRDGPGWRTIVDLPRGVEADKLIAVRDRLSSAMRLPRDQVWPEASRVHAGRLELWVGYQPASEMTPPAWAACDRDARMSVFDPVPFGTDPRARNVELTLFESNVLIGGQPGSGKSYAGRALALLAALDPTTELLIHEFKGTADLGDLEDLASTYVCGVDEDAFAQAEASMAWLLGEAERRAKRIRVARAAGDAPEGKITPALAARKNSGLHPIVAVFDEVHELFGTSAQAAGDMERLIKRGRALGIIVILITQIPDAKSMPPNVTRCVSHRWCLSVAGQWENDVILGTGSYKRGITATCFVPREDAGWGVMTGLKAPTHVRSRYPSADQAAAIIQRATDLRAGRVVSSRDTRPARNLLADLLEAAAGGRGQHWTTAAETLVQRWPADYPGLTADALGSRARDLGVTSTTVNISGTRLKGYRTDQLHTLLATTVNPDPGAESAADPDGKEATTAR